MLICSPVDTLIISGIHVLFRSEHHQYFILMRSTIEQQQFYENIILQLYAFFKNTSSTVEYPFHYSSGLTMRIHHLCLA